MNSPINTTANDPFGNQLIDDMRWLGRLAALLVSDPGLADDACQEAWMSASAASDGRPTREQLALGVRRFLLMHWRGSARRRAREHASARKDIVPAVDQLLARRESQMRIWNELVDLGDPHRRTLLMRFQEGLSTRQIANALGATQDTVRRHIREGVAMLRQRLQADRSGGGLAGILAALPTSVRGGQVTVKAGVHLGFSATSVKAGAIFVALAACALVLFSLLAGPVAPQIEPMSVSEPPDESVEARTAFLEPVPVEDRSALTASNATSQAAESTAEVLSKASLARGKDPHKVRVVLRTQGGADLPKRVLAVLECMHDGGFTLGSVRCERDVIGGHFDISLADLDSASFIKASQARITVTADGFGTQTCSPFDLNWERRFPSSVEFLLSSTSTIPVRVVDAISRAAIRDARLTMRGASDVVAGDIRTNRDGLARLPLLIPGAGHSDRTEDHLFVQGEGTAIGHWTRAELELLPLQRDGTRTLELGRASTVRGRVVLESGGPVPQGSAIVYSMERSREQTSFDFPHWLEPEGQIELDEEGRFEIDGLTMGLLVLHPRASRRHGAPALGPDFMVDIPASKDCDITLTLPSDPTVLTLHLEWLSPKQLLFVRLYEIDSTDAPYLDATTPRSLLARKNWVPVLEDVPILLPKGTLEEGRPYLLEVGPDFDNFLQRLIIFDGEAPRLKHSFAAVAALECPSEKGGGAEQQLRSRKSLTVARKAGAQTVLHARTE